MYTSWRGSGVTIHLGVILVVLVSRHYRPTAHIYTWGSLAGSLFSQSIIQSDHMAFSVVVICVVMRESIRYLRNKNILSFCFQAKCLAYLCGLSLKSHRSSPSRSSQFIPFLRAKSTKNNDNNKHVWIGYLHCWAGCYCYLCCSFAHIFFWFWFWFNR